MVKSISIHGKEFEEYLDEHVIEERIAGMAEELESKYHDVIPVFLIVLNGASFFAIDLIKNYSKPCQIAFIQLSSYAGTTSTMEVKVMSEISISLAGRHVIILEDIIDTGLTLKVLTDKIKSLDVVTTSVVTLLDKPSRRIKETEVAISGFTIPDIFVVGYGLDYDELGRNSKNIFAEK